MGLDWHAVVYDEDNESCVSPCKHVNAPHMRDMLNFKEFVAKHVESHRAEARKILNSDAELVKQYNIIQKNVEQEETTREIQYAIYWLNVTMEEKLEEIAKYVDCQNCPLLQALDGANSEGSPFIGITVTTCDFRGKMIGANQYLSKEVRDEAYEDKGPSNMLMYASRIESELEQLIEDEAFEPESYEAYVREVRQLQGSSREILTRDEYISIYGAEREIVIIRQAIHWLRTMAKMRISMRTSY